MKRFAELYDRLDRTTATKAKVAHLVDYFGQAEPDDAAWAVYFLSGRRLKRLVNTRELREWTAELSGLPLWLIEECYEQVGDLAETMHLLLPEAESVSQLLPLADLIESSIRPLGELDDRARRARVIELWQSSQGSARFLINKLLTGGFRVGVSKRLITRALAELAGVDSALIAHRLMGRWQPDAAFFRTLIASEADSDFAQSTPYPFFLASPLDGPAESLGDRKSVV